MHRKLWASYGSLVGQLGVIAHSPPPPRQFCKIKGSLAASCCRSWKRAEESLGIWETSRIVIAAPSACYRDPKPHDLPEVSKVFRPVGETVSQESPAPMQPCLHQCNPALHQRSVLWRIYAKTPFTLSVRFPFLSVCRSVSQSVSLSLSLSLSLVAPHAWLRCSGTLLQCSPPVIQELSVQMLGVVAA